MSAAGYDLPVPGSGDVCRGGYSYAEKPKRPMGAGPAFGLNLGEDHFLLLPGICLRGPYN